MQQSQYFDDVTILEGVIEKTKFIGAEVFIQNIVEGTRYPTSNKVTPAYCILSLNIIIKNERVICVEKNVLEIIVATVIEMMDYNIAKRGV